MNTNINSKDVSTLLFGKARRAILSLLYRGPEKSYYLRQIVGITGFGLRTVQREVRFLPGVGIITRRVSGHQVYLLANTASPVFNELKSLITKTVGIGDTLRTALASLNDRIRVAFTIGASSDLVDQLDTFRKKRNISDYERAGAVSEQEAREMLGLARLLLEGVTSWLKKNHPELI